MKKGLFLILFLFPLIIMGQGLPNQGQEGGNADLEFYEQQIPHPEKTRSTFRKSSKKELKKLLRTFIKETLRRRKGKPAKAPNGTQNFIQELGWLMLIGGLVGLLIILLVWLLSEVAGSILIFLFGGMVVTFIAGGILLLMLDRAWRRRKKKHILW